MNFTSKTLASQPEILKRHSGAEHTVPITLDFTAVTANSDGDFVVKAGSPISAAGVVDNATAPIGILLTDTYKERPIGTILKAFGVVNQTNANANSGLTISAATKTALPLIVFE
jgi:hypothetical protein